MKVGELKFLPPVERMPASRLAPAGKIEPMPATLSPMLAEIADAPFHRPEWLWEPKLDGYRVLAFIDRNGIKLRSRRGLELSRQFPRLVAELAKQEVDGMILDGELVAFDAGGRPSFGAMQDRAQLKTEREIAAADEAMPVVFVCFDLLYFAGVDLRKAAYEDRRRYLAQCLLPSPLVQLVHVAEDGIALHDAAVASGFEGVVGKRKASRYEAGRRSGSWLKVKPTQTRRLRDRRLHRGQGVARAFGGGAGGLLGRRQAALRIARRLGLRQQVARAGQGAPLPARAKDAAVRGRTRAQRAHDVGEACRRGRGELPELDRRRPPARARVPAPARRHRCK